MTDKKNKPKLIIHSSQEAIPEQPPIDWIVTNMFQRPALHVMVGDSSVGKTWAFIDCCVSLAGGELGWLGLNILRKNDVPVKVLIVDEESGHARLLRRLHKVMKGHDNWTENIFFVTMEGLNLSEEIDIQRVEDAIIETQAQIVFIDSLTEITPGKDMNERHEMMPALGALRRLAERQNIAVVVIHHENKGGKFTGSQAILNKADEMILLKREKDGERLSNILNITFNKQRDSGYFNLNADMRWDDENDSFMMRNAGTAIEKSRQEIREKIEIELKHNVVVNYNTICKAVGGNRADVAKELDAMEREKLVAWESGKRKSKEYHWVTDTDID